MTRNLLALLLLTGVLAGSAFASGGTSRDQAARALARRSEALNAAYHLGSASQGHGGPSLSVRDGRTGSESFPDQQQTRDAGTPAHAAPASAPSPAEIAAAERATALRSQALNRTYGLGDALPSSRSGFSWGDSGIGAAAMLGVIALAAAAVGARRRSRRDGMNTAQPTSG